MSSRLPWIDPLTQLQFCRFSTSSSPSESQWGSGCWCEHWCSPLSADHSKSQNKTWDRLKRMHGSASCWYWHCTVVVHQIQQHQGQAEEFHWRKEDGWAPWSKLMQSQRKSFNEYLVCTVRKRESEKGSTGGRAPFVICTVLVPWTLPRWYFQQKIVSAKICWK